MTGIAAGIAILTGVALGWWGAVVVVVAALLTVLVARSRPARAVCAVAIIAAILGAWRAESPLASTSAGASASSGIVRVVTAPVQTGRFQHFVVESDESLAATHGAAARICVAADPYPTVQVGDLVRIGGVARLAIDVSVSQRAYLAARGCALSLFAEIVRVVDSNSDPNRVLAEARARLGAVLRSASPGDAGVLLTGLVTGDDAGFSTERERAFIQTGTTHLTAVSGSNLALVAGILATMGAATVGRHRFAWQTITLAGIWGYALVSGAQAPAVRAAIVASAAVLAYRFGRRPDFPTLILLAAGAMALLEPRQVESLGFRLSVAASLALAVVLPGMVQDGRFRVAPAALVGTMAAQLATLPLLLPIFGTISLVSVPANLLVAPLVALAMPLAMLAGLVGVVWKPLGEAIAAPSSVLANLTLAIVDGLGEPSGYVVLGVPPVSAALAFAATITVVLAIFSGDAAREILRVWQKRLVGPAETGAMESSD